MQLLFERSDETPGVEGLGILKGEILRIPETFGLKIPQNSEVSEFQCHCSSQDGTDIRRPVPSLQMHEYKCHIPQMQSQSLPLLLSDNKNFVEL